jgi:hypothetical protein
MHDREDVIVAVANKVTRAGRAAKYELVYRALGGDRTILRVSQIVRGAGDTISLKTLERYSRDYGWVERAHAYDEERTQVISGIVLEHAVANDVAIASLWKRIREVTEQRLESFAEAEQDPPSLIEIARAADIATRNERLIGGQATERIEIMGSAMRILTEQIGPLVVRLTDRVLDWIEQSVRPESEGLANSGQVMIEDALTSFGSDADRVVDAEFRAYGLLAEQATVRDEGDDD